MAPPTSCRILRLKTNLSSQVRPAPSRCLREWGQSGRLRGDSHRGGLTRFSAPAQKIRLARAAPRELVDAQAAVSRADHLVLLFPLWLGTMPAVVKALLKQILRPSDTCAPTVTTATSAMYRLSPGVSDPRSSAPGPRQIPPGPPG